MPYMPRANHDYTEALDQRTQPFQPVCTPMNISSCQMRLISPLKLVHNLYIIHNTLAYGSLDHYKWFLKVASYMFIVPHP